MSDVGRVAKISDIPKSIAVGLDGPACATCKRIIVAIDGRRRYAYSNGRIECLSCLEKTLAKENAEKQP